jgi:hypothetical protein
MPRTIADNDVDEVSFQWGFAVGVFAGLLFGILFGVLRWRTEAVQAEEAKQALGEVTRYHETCALNLKYERENPLCPTPPKPSVLNGGRQ